jgi:MoaF N-terminal domain
MAQPKLAPTIRGKTIRLTWTEGPTKGSTYEHVFHEDGTVEWRGIDGSGKTPAKATPAEVPSKQERAQYGAVQVTDEIYVLSYLAPSGYTLTVVLNFRDHRMVGFASGAKEWYPLQGTFEVM